MAGLPVNNTNRFLWTYFDGVNSHVQMWRYPEAVDVEAVKLVVEDFWTALIPVLNLITFQSCSLVAINTAVSLPTAWTGSATYGDGALSLQNSPRELRWEGYSVGGRKVSWAVYGADVSVPATYRFQADEVASLDDATAILRAAMAGGTICAIDGLPANVKSYINFNFNSFWETARRG